MNAFKTNLKSATQKTKEAAGNLVGNKTGEKITEAASKTLVVIQADHLYQQMTDQCNQQEYQKRSTNHQKDINKLLMNFDCYNFKYIARC